VCDLETSKEEAKARYWAVNTNPQWVGTPRERKKKQHVVIMYRNNNNFNEKYWAVVG